MTIKPTSPLAKTMFEIESISKRAIADVKALEDLEEPSAAAHLHDKRIIARALAIFAEIHETYVDPVEDERHVPQLARVSGDLNHLATLFTDVAESLRELARDVLE